MDMQPSTLSAKTPNETVTVSLKLAVELGADTVASVVWSSCPGGLTFADATITDSSQTVQANVSGGSHGCNYIIKALCTLSTGDVKEPWVRMPVIKAGG